MVGRTITHYRVLEELGQGGMGVVYKAEDTKLERTVALKFLAAHLLSDEEAKRRFLREAKAAAGLHHPNLCPVYEIDEAEGKTFLAMAYLKGATLEDRISQRPMPITDALDIGRQLAEGLQAAHAEGIVHRDVKPANVLVSPEGRATIMDFGLARLTEASRLTRQDQTVGTAAYMSPEQIQGGEVDHRTDIWALGCVLYEMVAGAPPFQGQYDQALAYEVIHEEFEPLTAVRAGVPMELEFIVGKSLAKKAAERYQNSEELGVDLRNLRGRLESGRFGDSSVAPPMALPPIQTSLKNYRWRERIAWALAVALALSLAVVIGSRPESRQAAARARRFAFTIPGLRDPSISPDGGRIAYEAGGRLWIQDLNQNEPRLLAQSGAQPIWSPDGEAVGFFSDRQLWRTPVWGGAADLICEVGSNMYGAAWSPDGETIVFSATSRPSTGVSLFEVSARGGTPTQVVWGHDWKRSADGGVERFPLFPNFLFETDHRRVAFGFARRPDDPDSQVVVLDLETGKATVVGPGTRPAAAPNGHLAYSDASGRLWVLPLSRDRPEPASDAFPIARSGMNPSFSRDGSLVYHEHSQSNVRLVWHDRAGVAQEAVGQAQRSMRHPDLSPDAESALVVADDDVWLHDLRRGLATNLTASADQEIYPVWAPWGALFRRNDKILFRPFDLSRETAMLIDRADRQSPYHVDPAGRYLVYGESSRYAPWNIWVIESDPSGTMSEPMRFVRSDSSTVNAQISPQGRHLAYASSGRADRNDWQIVVQPFPEGGPLVIVSTGEGKQPRWNPTGGELFYVDDDTLVSVSLTLSPQVRVENYERLFSTSWLRSTLARPTYAVSPDGERFLIPVPDPGGEASDSKIRFVENWYEDFSDRQLE